MKIALDSTSSIQKNEKLNLDALRIANGQIAAPAETDDPYRPALMKKMWKRP